MAVLVNGLSFYTLLRTLPGNQGNTIFQTKILSLIRIEISQSLKAVGEVLRVAFMSSIREGLLKDLENPGAQHSSVHHLLVNEYIASSVQEHEPLPRHPLRS